MAIERRGGVANVVDFADEEDHLCDARVAEAGAVGVDARCGLARLAVAPPRHLLVLLLVLAKDRGGSLSAMADQMIEE